MDDDAVARLQGQAVEGVVPRAGGGFLEGDLFRVAAEHGGGGSVEVVQPVLRRVRRLVAADLLLQREVGEEGILDKVRAERAARIVEVDQRLAGGRVGAELPDIHDRVSRKSQDRKPPRT